jgi:hypothetical protein
MDDHIRNNHDWPRASLALFDALQTYILVSDLVRRDMLSLGLVSEITEEHLDRCRALLSEIEKNAIDPHLDDGDANRPFKGLPR